MVYSFLPAQALKKQSPNISEKKTQMSEQTKSFAEHFIDTLPNPSEMAGAGFNKIISGAATGVLQSSFSHVDPLKVDEITRETTKLATSVFKTNSQVGFTQYKYDTANKVSSGYKYICKGVFFVLDLYKQNPLAKYSHVSRYTGDLGEYICEVPAKFIKNVGFAKQNHAKIDSSYETQSLLEYTYKQFNIFWVTKSLLECVIVIPSKKGFDALIGSWVTKPLTKSITPPIFSSFVEGSIKGGSFLWFSRVAEKAADFSLDKLNIKHNPATSTNQEQNNKTSSNATFFEALETQEQLTSFDISSLNTSASNKNSKALSIFPKNLAYNSSNQGHINSPYCHAPQSKHYDTFSDAATINMFLTFGLIAIDSTLAPKDFASHVILDLGMITYALNINPYISSELRGIDQCIYNDAVIWTD